MPLTSARFSLAWKRLSACLVGAALAWGGVTAAEAAKPRKVSAAKPSAAKPSARVTQSSRMPAVFIPHREGQGRRYAPNRNPGIPILSNFIVSKPDKLAFANIRSAQRDGALFLGLVFF